MNDAQINKLARGVRRASSYAICALLCLQISGGFTVARAVCAERPELMLPDSETGQDGLTATTTANLRAPDIIALTTDNRLVRFNSADPGKIISDIPITGNLQPGETIVAIDYDPSQVRLYGLGSTGRVYSLSELTGFASPLIYLPFLNQGMKIGLDFDPVVPGALRLVTDAGQNQMLGKSGFAGATNLAYATADVNAGRTPNVVSLAYDNNYFRADSTTAYAIDSELDALVRLGSIGGSPVSPDSGQLFTVGSLLVNTSNSAGFDIAAGSGVAYASLTSPGEAVSRLYTINLTTGRATAIGIIGGGRSILDITVAPLGILMLDPPVDSCYMTATFGEWAGIIPFGVYRYGDTSNAATVDYDLAQGSNVKEGSNVIGTFGRLYFAPGEGYKNFSVFLIDDANVEGSKNLIIKLIRPTGGYFLTNEGGWVITITDNDNPQSATNPIDQARFFVREHYIDFLHREPDTAGLLFWMNQIAGCASDANCLALRRISVSASFFLSIEFQETGFLVYRFYQASFGRMPLLNEFLADKQVMSQGVVVNSPGWEQQLENNKVAFANFWTDRPDFRGLYADKTNAQYVNTLMANTGVVFSPADRDVLIDGLDNATETRASVLRKIAENQTFAQQEFNRAFVLMEYFGYLRRNPNGFPDSDYSGYDFWLTKLNQFNGDYQKSEMVRAFINSAEYRQRFGP